MNHSKHELASAEEELFLKKALASIENARRFQKIKQVILTTLAFIAAFWFASKRPGSELNVECTILIFVGLIAAICTAKMMSLINKNTKAILEAIAELHQKLRAQQ
jgi:hypothetical protein